MMTRAEYLADWTSNEEMAARHRAYYGQFVGKDVITLVCQLIGKEEILASRDPHFNDIPLRNWDVLVPSLVRTHSGRLRECGDSLCLSSGVCILKEAAQQIREGKVLQ